MKALMLCPWFGPLPEWWGLYAENIGRLAPDYEWLVDTDLVRFKRRCQNVLGVEFPGVEGGSKIHDWRPALGLLYEDELRGYDFWGHTDFDCVYGRIDRWLTPGVLDSLDIHSNHGDYICGPWTLYRNTPITRHAFKLAVGWKEHLERPDTTGWAEREFTATIDLLHRARTIRRLYTYWQTRSLTDLSQVRWDGDRLMDGDEEIFMCHFRRTKTYPPLLT